jgi:peptide/nickel transport system substrate-binding protein
LRRSAAATAIPGCEYRAERDGGIGNVFVRNFNPFNGNPLLPTIAGIYEPMMIYNTAKNAMVPWLATSYQWSTNNKTLTLTLRDGVKWSDGQTFTADDVVYTFNLFKKTQGLQGTGLQAMLADNVESVSSTDAKTVVFHFTQPYTPALYDIIQQNIVPQHIWKSVSNPVTYANPNPVATGPFTQVTSFQSQVYEVDKNPYYWQPGKPAYKGVRVQEYSGNEQAAVAIANGQIDWASNFIPNIQQTVLSRNAKIKTWFPTIGELALLELNQAKKPFTDVNVRKAISMALNRDQMIKVGVSGYTKPADVTGLSDGYSAWKASDPGSLGDWTTYNPAKANQLLDAAGYKMGSDGIRVAPDGTPMNFTLTLANGFSDWISAGQIMVPNLKAIGINATIKMIDPSTLFDVEPKGNFDMTLWFGFSAATPFTFYKNVMSKSTVVPIGTPTFTNFSRYASPKADALLTQFASTSDVSQQKQLAIQLQQAFANEAPVIPLWPAPDYMIFNTAHFTGWPSANNPYAAGFLQGSVTPEQLIVMTTVKPK